jgi:CspA family cold shock protein
LPIFLKHRTLSSGRWFRGLRLTWATTPHASEEWSVAQKSVRVSEAERLGEISFGAREPTPARRGVFGGRNSGNGVMTQQGTVKFFNAEKGYGFIKPDDGGRDIFVHITAVETAGLRSLAEGQRITYDIEPDKKGKGPKAVSLQLD